jgi:hypothetical protein
VRRLRAMGHPIRLFGETDKQCKVRLRALELMDEQSGVSQVCVHGCMRRLKISNRIKVEMIL